MEAATKLRHLIPRRPIPVLASCLIAMLVVESAVRLLWIPSVVGLDRYSAISPSFDFGFELAQPVCLERGDRWLCLPTQYRNAVRRQELPRPKSESAVRFITLGGSVSAGGPESYTHRLRDELERRYAGVRWEALNLSHHGYGTARMRVLMERVPRFEPDFVILDCTGTNEYEDERARARRNALYRGLGAVMYRSRALVLIKKKLTPGLAAAGGNAVSRFRWPTEEEANAVAENVERWLTSLDRNLAGMLAIAREHDIPVVLMGRSVREPIAPGSRYDRINAVIRSRAVGPETRYVDTQGALHRLERTGVLYGADGLHLSAAGHEALAKVLAGRVVPDLPRIELRVKRIAAASGAGR